VSVDPPPARIVSVNVGLPREVAWRGEIVTTSIFKSPVAGRVMVRRLNLDGDRQSDLTVHGGADKAVYAYPSEHYAWWREQLPGAELPWGSFGENLTTEGLLESEVRIGDRWTIGEAGFRITQPRMPCFKLGIRFDRPDMVKRFLRSGRSGFYLGVERVGEVAAGDAIAVTAVDPGAVTVADVVGLYTVDRGDPVLLRRASELASLPENWREYFRKRAWTPDAS
jgi:MOSC domain-containing protein YiiM